MSVQRYTFWATNTQQATFYACATEGEFPTEEVGPKDVVYYKGALKKRNASNSAWVAVNPEDVLMHTDVTEATIPGLMANARIDLILSRLPIPLSDGPQLPNR